MSDCCLHDLCQLKTQDDVYDATSFSDEMWEVRGPWQSCREAVDEMAPEHGNEDLAFLVEWYKNRDPELSAEISRVLAARGVLGS